MENTIFVQIASYKDPELLNTLNDLINQAKYPELLHIGIAWQHDSNESIEDFLDEDFDVLGFEENYSHIEEHERIQALINMNKNGARLTVLDIDFDKTKGACWARHKIQQVYNGEKYTLQLDSHHRFVEGWDELSVNILEDLRSEEYPKPLLTAYIPSFDPENDPANRVDHPWKMDFDRFIPEGAVFFRPSSIDEWKELDQPVPARFFSAHFTFVDGDFAVNVQHDPNYFFHGEEISLAVRAFTHGYDLFHPHRVIAWHEYTRKGRTKVWDDHTTPRKEEGRVDLDWVERNNLSHNRNRILFGMDGEDPNQIDFGKYGFGNVRTLREYEEYAGISFEYRGVQQYTLDKEYPPNDYEYTTEEEWKDSLRILFHRDELGEPKDDYDFFYVGAHDEEYDEIYREDLTQPKITQYLKNEWIDFRLIFLANRIPKTFTIWPHSKKDGWGERIIKNVE
jgi:hypothetical protein